MIIAFNGKSEWLTNMCLGSIMWASGIIRESFKVDANDRLHVSDLLGDSRVHGIFNIHSIDEQFNIFLHNEVYPVVRIYNKIDLIKAVCNQIYGVPKNLVYNDKMKNIETEFTDRKILKIGVGDKLTVEELISAIYGEYNNLSETFILDYLLRIIHNNNSRYSIIIDDLSVPELIKLQQAESTIIKFKPGVPEFDYHYSIEESAKDLDYILNQIGVYQDYKVVNKGR